jgi:hypothetical protein
MSSSKQAAGQLGPCGMVLGKPEIWDGVGLQGLKLATLSLPGKGSQAISPASS